MNTIEKKGKSVEAALRLALARLGAKRDEVDIEILQEPTKGVLGLFGGKKAHIRVTKKGFKPEKEEVSIKEDSTDQSKVKTDTLEKRISKSIKKEKKLRKKKVNKQPEPIKEKSIEKEVDSNEVTVQAVVNEFLLELLNEMDINAQLDMRRKNENLYVDISGDDMALVIGRRGKTLDALQYLTSLVTNRDRDDYVRVLLDAENYRAKRKRTLQNLARKLAKKAKKKHRNIVLEPMNPYERRIIHSTLQNEKGVTTRSKGKEPYRKVVICYNEKE